MLPDHIEAGQKDAKGIYYFDFEPDIECRVSNPWVKQDTAIILDLNKDGVDDFTFYRKMCHPGYLGGDCDRITLIPAGPLRPMGLNQKTRPAIVVNDNA